MEWDEYFDSAAQGRRPTSDFEWYALDRKGQIAILTSAGFGAIPLVVFRDKTMYYEVAAYFRSLPLRCDHKLLAKKSVDCSFWIEQAWSGLFGYDWNVAAGQYVPGAPYELIAAPEKPLTVLELPTDLQLWISIIRFDAEFGVATELFPEQQFADMNL